ncbi:thiosulfate sulfurtransferase GlpE [Ningiella sp. W23]|uniref:thiosulfate sulfurtransferase GlpE n=1 Tax=Ningiella sp. W23 TaxID=3023715 RepID=UPI0037565AA8
MEQFEHISVEQTKQRLDKGDITLVDIRDPQSFNLGHIPNAFHLSNESMPQFMQDHPFDVPVVVCCYHGISSQQAAQYMIGQGYKEVYSMDGGFEAWRGQYPVELGE